MQPPFGNRKVRFAVFEVDLQTGELRKSGSKVKLQEQPFQILSLLLERPGELVMREELRKKLWPADTFVDFDVGLNASIKKLREALGDSADTPRFIETLPRRGYRFIAPAEEVLAGIGGREGQRSFSPATAVPGGSSISTAPEAAAPSPRQPELEKDRTKTTLVRRPLLLGGASAAILLALLFGLNAGGLRERLQGKAFAGNATAGRIRSLAVLPLENLSRDADQEYFADGMTDALITDLGKIGGLRVISRTSMMHYKGTRKTLPEIARELNVDAVIEGAVLRSGNRVRITTQLLEASTDRHLWAETYERDLGDLLALQGEVAREVAGQVNIKLTQQERTRLLGRQPVDPEAMEAYLKGRYELRSLQLDKGIEHFKQALQREPNYGQAWAGLAGAYDALSYPSQLADTGELAEKQSLNTQLLAKSKAAALKALQLDESLSEAHVSLGQVLMDMDWSWGAAEREFQRAITLDPNNAAAHQAYGEHLMAWGRLDEAIAELSRATDLDPFTWRTHYMLARTFSAASRYDEALQHWRESIALGCPTGYTLHRRMAIAYEGKGMEQEAVAELVAASKAFPKEQGTRRQDLAALVAQKYLSSGYAEAKKAFLRGDTWGGPIWKAEDYAELGENDKAFEWLNKTIQMNNPNRKYIKVDDRLTALRSNSSFQDFVRNLGFPH